MEMRNRYLSHFQDFMITWHRAQRQQSPAHQNKWRCVFLIGEKATAASTSETTTNEDGGLSVTAIVIVVGNTTEALSSEATTDEDEGLSITAKVGKTTAASISEAMKNEDEGLPIMATVGIVIGCIVLVVILMIVTAVICCKKSRNQPFYDEERVREKL